MRRKEKRKIGNMKEINRIVFRKFKKGGIRSGNGIPGSAKEAAEGAAFGILVLALAVTAMEVNAYGAHAELPQEYVRYCEEIGQAYHICPELLEAVIESESGGDPDAVGNLGETGLMQIDPKHHRDRVKRLGVHDLSNPRGNILAGTDYLAELFELYEDPGTALMAYNGTKDAIERGRRGDYTDYAEKVIKRAAQLERLHKK